MSAECSGNGSFFIVELCFVLCVVCFYGYDRPLLSSWFLFTFFCFFLFMFMPIIDIMIMRMKSRRFVVMAFFIDLQFRINEDMVV